MTREEELAAIDAAIRKGRMTRVTPEMLLHRGLLAPGTPEFKLTRKRFNGKRFRRQIKAPGSA